MIDAEEDREPPCCSFCDKDEADVHRLIAGHSAYICDECVKLCVSVIGVPVTDDEVMKDLMRIWSEFTRRRQWTAALMVGALAQLTDPGKPEPRAWSRGAMMTDYVVGQMKPPRLSRRARALRCDYCSKAPDETEFLHAGHGGQICGDCMERMQEARAWWDRAYREDLIKRLQALADRPEPPHGSPS